MGQKDYASLPYFDTVDPSTIDLILITQYFILLIKQNKKLNEQYFSFIFY